MHLEVEQGVNKIVVAALEVFFGEIRGAVDRFTNFGYNVILDESPHGERLDEADQLLRRQVVVLLPEALNEVVFHRIYGVPAIAVDAENIHKVVPSELGLNLFC